MTIREGYIKYYDPVRQAGTIKANPGRVLFYLSDGQVIVPGFYEPVFSGQKVVTFDGITRTFKDPLPGVRVVFDETELAHHRRKAAPWGYKDQYDHAQSVLKLYPMYRVLESRNIVGSTKLLDLRVLWEGKDLFDLVRRYPLPEEPRNGRNAHEDTLIPYTINTIGDIEIRHWFEQFQDGTWIASSDPRKHTQPVEGSLPLVGTA